MSGERFVLKSLRRLRQYGICRGVENTFFLTAEQEKNMENLYKDKESGAENELVDKRPLTEWIVENYMNFGAKLESAHLCRPRQRSPWKNHALEVR